MSQILHIHHTNEVWHIQAALCTLQHSSLEDFPALGPPAHLTCSSLHIPPSPTAISLFFCWHFSVRLAFDTLSTSARCKRWCQCRQQPKQAGLIRSATSSTWQADARGSTGCELPRERSRAPQRLITSRNNHYSWLKFLSCTSALDRAWALLKEWVSKLGLSSSY